jgi:hypothetical protein
VTWDELSHADQAKLIDEAAEMLIAKYGYSKFFLLASELPAETTVEQAASQACLLAYERGRAVA